MMTGGPTLKKTKIAIKLPHCFSTMILERNIEMSGIDFILLMVGVGAVLIAYYGIKGTL